MNRRFTWKVTAQIETHVTSRMGEWGGSRQVPTFYVSDIITAGLAESVAREIINPLGSIPAHDLHITVSRMDGGEDSPSPYPACIRDAAGVCACEGESA